MNEALIVVGDVHGDVDRLNELMRILGASGRRVIFVGDYVDRGRDSRGVLNQLSEAWRRQADRFVFLMGNHDLALLDYLDNGDFVRFASLGGIPTIRSYIEDAIGNVHGAFSAAFPPLHRAFLRALRPCWESASLLVSHAGYDPDNPTSRNLDALVMGCRPAIFQDARPPAPLVVCGHYLQDDRKPFLGEHLICLDTSCGVGGPLTAIKLPERELITV